VFQPTLIILLDTPNINRLCSGQRSLCSGALVWRILSRLDGGRLAAGTWHQSFAEIGILARRGPHVGIALGLLDHRVGRLGHAETGLIAFMGERQFIVPG
jgi:hypothetical protein